MLHRMVLCHLYHVFGEVVHQTDILFRKMVSFFLPLLESGDIILADKGFTIGDLLPGPIGLNMPPFIASNAQMTQKEFFKTTNCRPYNCCRNENGSNQKLQNRPECTSFD